MHIYHSHKCHKQALHSQYRENLPQTHVDSMIQQGRPSLYRQEVGRNRYAGGHTHKSTHVDVNDALFTLTTNNHTTARDVTI